MSARSAEKLLSWLSRSLLLAKGLASLAQQRTEACSFVASIRTANKRLLNQLVLLCILAVPGASLSPSFCTAFRAVHSLICFLLSLAPSKSRAELALPKDRASSNYIARQAHPRPPSLQSLYGFCLQALRLCDFFLPESLPGQRARNHPAAREVRASALR